MKSKRAPFLWGAATSSHQIEGGNEHNDWWAWEAEGHVDGGVRSGEATDHWNRFREDLQLAASLGLNSYRFSIEWSRLEPEEGLWNTVALDRYGEILSECERLGLLPMLTLHHFTSPRWFAENGGFTQSGAAEKFAAYVSRVIEAFGPRIPLWCTINEPMVLVAGSYLGTFMPPGEWAPRLASQASHQLLRAHVLAYDLLHSQSRERKGPWKNWPLQVGIAHNMLDFLPDRRWHWAEKVLARIFDRFCNRAWLDAVTGRKQHFGVVGMIPYADQVQEARGRKTADFIGINYYTKAYVQWRPLAPAHQAFARLPVGVSFAGSKDKVFSDVEWAVHPKGLTRMLAFAGGYGLPIYVTENGIADREDRLRPAFLHSHLKAVARALAEGIDVRGYYYWSLLDNFEWGKGFGPRFGLYHVDYETLARKPTKSAEVYRTIIEAHRAHGDGGPRVEYFRS